MLLLLEDSRAVMMILNMVYIPDGSAIPEGRFDVQTAELVDWSPSSDDGVIETDNLEEMYIYAEDLRRAAPDTSNRHSRWALYGAADINFSGFVLQPGVEISFVREEDRVLWLPRVVFEAETQISQEGTVRNKKHNFAFVDRDKTSAERKLDLPNTMSWLWSYYTRVDEGQKISEGDRVDWVVAPPRTDHEQPGALIKTYL